MQIIKRSIRCFTWNDKKRRGQVSQPLLFPCAFFLPGGIMKRTENIYVLLALTLMLFFIWTYLRGYPVEQKFLFIERYFDIERLKIIPSRVQFSYAGQIISINSLGYTQFVKFIFTKFYDFLIFLLLSLLWSLGLKKRLKSNWMTALLSFVITMGFASMLELYMGWNGSQGHFLVEDFVLKSYGALTGIILARFSKRK